MQETLDYLYNLQRFGMKLGLEVTKKLLSSLENPHDSFKSIHIAGTNGKGSTAAFLFSILKRAGYKVGIYTSPHLVKFNERIKVNDQEITDNELVEYTKLVKQHADENDLQPTFFEFTTTMAFLHFKKKEVEFAIIETGMGGRLDATNLLTPELSIITNIDFDHVKHLGNNKLSIAKEKAAIIKEKGTLITAERDQEVLDLFNEVCKEKGAKLFNVDEEIKYKILESNPREQKFITFWRVNSSFTINLLGKYQIRNALTALLAADLLRERGINITTNDLKKGLGQATWPGRLEILQEDPLVIVDCAHNVAGMRELADFIRKMPQRKVLVLGIGENKESEKIIPQIVPFVDEVILTQGNYNPSSLETLEQETKKFTKKVYKYPKPEKAIEKSLGITKEDDIIIITGSIYLIGDVLKLRKLFK
jgi:dihydrofolate synthase / folylpolyglutamate synthase